MKKIICGILFSGLAGFIAGGRTLREGTVFTRKLAGAVRERDKRVAR